MRSFENLGIYAPGSLGLPQNPFGKDVANLELYQALVHHGAFHEIYFFVRQAIDQNRLIQVLRIKGDTPTVAVASVINVVTKQNFGTLFRGKADLGDLAWLRNQHRAQRAFSLVGLVHCIAPPALRDYIANAATAPVEPWDALICTSPVVKNNLERMFQEWNAYLRKRFHGTTVVARKPLLPIIPLGVDASKLLSAADRPAVRQSIRDELGVREDEVMVLWVGRLSFFEKAFPQPMFAALEAAQKSASKRIHFVMAGWFPNHASGHGQYSEAARVHAPSVPIHILDGRNQGLVGRLWAGADIFLSLVDNVQETFGLTPLEAMAAGVPVVVSDWDGYRASVEHGVQGFRIRSLGGPAGLGDVMLRRHILEIDSYQTYVGHIAQHTAIDVQEAADAISTLASRSELRSRMGAAGRRLIKERFDWPVIVECYRSLFAELQSIRLKADPFGDYEGSFDPVRTEPFACFAEFSTSPLDQQQPRLRLAGHQNASKLSALAALDRFGAFWRASDEEMARIIALLAEQESAGVGEILRQFPAERANPIRASVMWMCKMGLLKWT